MESKVEHIFNFTDSKRGWGFLVWKLDRKKLQRKIILRWFGGLQRPKVNNKCFLVPSIWSVKVTREEIDTQSFWISLFRLKIKPFIRMWSRVYNRCLHDEWKTPKSWNYWTHYQGHNLRPCYDDDPLFSTSTLQIPPCFPWEVFFLMCCDPVSMVFGKSVGLLPSSLSKVMMIQNGWWTKDL